jgi:flagellar FliL protein
VTLEVESEKKGEGAMEEEKPRLRDAIIFVLGQKSYNDLLSTSGKTRLKEDIRVACNGGLGRDVVKEVLFTDFAMQ